MKSFNNRSGQAGFTLIEILVALILLAVLAAAVYPVVTQQSGQGDAVGASQTLTGIRAGIEQFTLDLKQKQPGDLEDLSSRITVAADSSIDGALYVAKDSLRWNGPYIDASLANGDSIRTGFDGMIQDNLVRFDGTANVVGFNAAHDNFVAVVVKGLQQVEFDRINKVIDGDLETSSATSGRFRRIGAVSYYLATPILQ